LERELTNAAFWRFPEPHLKALSEQGALRAYPKHSVIVNEGDRTDSLYVIRQGAVKIYLADAEGKEVELATQGPGEYFGEMILDEGPRSASVMTLEASKFSVVSAQQFKAYLAQHPDLAEAIMRSLVARVRKLTRMVGDLTLLDVYGRVARLLLDLAAAQQGDPAVIERRLTQQDIANRIGASREMVSRILKDLRLGGYIRQDSGRIVILRKPPSAW
jgi:CRP/FNR family cyclic AMP-dependent transcriptional regulator